MRGVISKSIIFWERKAHQIDIVRNFVVYSHLLLLSSEGRPRIQEALLRLSRVKKEG